MLAELTGFDPLAALQSDEDLARLGDELLECEAASRAISPLPLASAELSTSLADLADPPAPASTASSASAYRQQSTLPPGAQDQVVSTTGPTRQAVAIASQFPAGLDPRFAANLPRGQARLHRTERGSFIHFPLATTPNGSTFMGVLVGPDGSGQAVFSDPDETVFDPAAHAARVSKMAPGAQGWFPLGAVEDGSVFMGSLTAHSGVSNLIWLPVGGRQMVFAGGVMGPTGGGDEGGIRMEDVDGLAGKGVGGENDRWFEEL